MILELLFIFIIVAVGSYIQSVSGFGFGLIAMSLLPFLFHLLDSTLLIMSLTIVLTLRILMRFYPYIEFNRLSVILISAIIGRIGGFFILTHFGELPILKKWLGVVLLLLVVYLWFNKKPSQGERKVATIFTICLGLVGGLIGGVFAVGGPFFVFYFLTIYEDKLKYTANLQAVFFITSLLTVVSHGINGDFHSSFMLYFLTGFVAVLIGSGIGVRSFTKWKAEKIRILAMVIVAISAINLLLFS
ncbi:sulfite exporter TauE/SafE family protein [Alkalihalobacillus trypoxylicola]|uniref:Probable membrane transporter protein n=1 Tax=Alkalihalobacillus trypoxylicola TaxID=519424 RepID=A0A162EKT6_9BACI|nr:sulfite exporter TauE/SafE family protein [Alkalihalobacillus trypoxylicola]KYG33143.1 hypothetical protein AZF04_17510 [Alkalihalobacillus trypoxylicola]